MSKLREHIPETHGELSTPPEGDLAPWVIFTQLKPGGPYIYAGWLDAVDADMALHFAREHYGQDQECVSIRAIPRGAITGTEPEYAPRDSAGGVTKRSWTVFVQKRSGDQYVSIGTLEAAGSSSALEAAKKLARGGPSSIWVAPQEAIAETAEGDVIWRLTDRTYRLARGYSALVRDKWHKVRSDRDLSEYEKDDLKESFSSAIPDDLVQPLVDLLLSVADDKLVLGHRNADWTGLAPILEEDIAFSALAQDEIAHAQALYELVAPLAGRTADELAFGRDAGALRCCALVELPDEFDWATALARRFFCDHLDALRLARLARSSHKPLADLAARLCAEEQIHVEHADGWVRRLGAGTDESRQRMQSALEALALYVPGLFEPVEGQADLVEAGLYPGDDDAMLAAWKDAVGRTLYAAGLSLSVPEARQRQGGRRGRHTPHLAELLAEMSEVWRVEPGASW